MTSTPALSTISLATLAIMSSVGLPGMDESNIDVKFSDGTLTIKGEKKVSTSRHSSAFDERMIGNLIQLSYLNNSVARLSINRATIGIAQPRGALRFSSVIATRK